MARRAPANVSAEFLEPKDLIRLRFRHSLSPSARSPPPQSGRTSQAKKKKRKPRVMRRHTLSGGGGSGEAASSIHSHKKATGKEWLAKEREKFLELLRARHPEQAAAVESELEWKTGHFSSGGPNRKAKGGVLYLQFNGETRRVAIPSDLSLDSLRMLFADCFAHTLDRSQLEPPAGTIYIQDPTTTHFYQLTDASDVHDKAILTVHLFNPRASLASPNVPPPPALATPGGGGGGGGGGIDQFPFVYGKASSVPPPFSRPEKSSSIAFDGDSDLSLEKLERMQEQLSQLTGLVQMAVSRGKSVGDLNVEVDGIEDVFKTPGKVMTARSLTSLSSTSSAPSGANPAILSPPPKPKRLYLETGSVNASATAIHGKRQPGEDPRLPFQQEWTYQPLSVDEKALVARSADGLVKNIQKLKTELDVMRRQHKAQCETFFEMMKKCEEKIIHAIITKEPRNIIASEKRGSVIREELEFQERSGEMFEEISDLATTVEEIRIDVLKRHCKVDMNELSGLMAEVKRVGKMLTEERKKFVQLHDQLKPAMTSELEVIVREEKFLKEQTAGLEEHAMKCKRMHGALVTLKRFGSVQEYRTLSVPLIMPTAYEPQRQELLQNILALAPNHVARAQSVDVAEHSYALRKQLMSTRKAQQVANILDANRKRLKPVHRVLEQLEFRRAHLVSQMYLEDQQLIPQQSSWQDGRRYQPSQTKQSDVHQRHPSEKYPGWRSSPVMQQEVMDKEERRERPQLNGYTGDDEMGPLTRKSKTRQTVQTTPAREKDAQYYQSHQRHQTRSQGNKSHSLSPADRFPVNGHEKGPHNRLPEMVTPRQRIDPRHTKSANWTRTPSGRDGYGDVSEYYSRSGPSVSNESQLPLSPHRFGGGYSGEAVRRPNDQYVKEREGQGKKKTRPLSAGINRTPKPRRKEIIDDLDFVTTDL